MSAYIHYEKLTKIVVTGAAGFIGFHVSEELLKKGFIVYGIDSLNDYYDPELKKSRLKLLQLNNNFNFLKQDISHANIINTLKEIKPDVIVNLAAQAGVRHSLSKPSDYISSNISSFLNILEFAKQSDNLLKIVYASTSSVYGGNIQTPFKEKHRVDLPLQFYAVTKRANELMAHAYANLYGIKSIGLRFFTVYGPWGRPDMALFKFTKNIIEDKQIDIFNNGNHVRDFTYISDIVDGVVSVSVQKSAVQEELSEIYNIGGSNPVALMDFIHEIEKNIGKEAIKNFLPIQPGDVSETKSSIKKISDAYGFMPKVSYKEGIKNFIDWYKSYYES